MKELYDINLYYTHNYTIKASIAERMMKVVQGKLYHSMDTNNNLNWTTHLKDIEKGLNLTRKKSIKNMTPLEVVTDPKKADILKKFYAIKTIEHEKKYGKKKWNSSDLSINDSVRILEPSKNIFEKSYKPPFSNEIYKIARINTTVPTTFFIDDPKYSKKAFYRSDLSKTWPLADKIRKKDLFIAAEKKVEGRVLRSGQKSNQKKLFLLKSKQNKDKAHWVDESEISRLKNKGLID